MNSSCSSCSTFLFSTPSSGSTQKSHSSTAGSCEESRSAYFPVRWLSVSIRLQIFLQKCSICYHSGSFSLLFVGLFFSSLWPVSRFVLAGRQATEQVINWKHCNALVGEQASTCQVIVIKICLRSVVRLRIGSWENLWSMRKIAILAVMFDFSWIGLYFFLWFNWTSVLDIDFLFRN